MTTLAAQPAVIQNQQGGMYKQLETMGTHKQVEAAKNVYVYLNGDRHFVGRKFVVNKKHIGNFDGFLNQVTVGIKAPFGAVRKIYTPNSGTRLEQLDQLMNGMDLVAGGGERFKKLMYKEISIKRRQPQKPAGNKVTRTGGTDFGTDTDFFDYEQFRNSHRMNVEARWRKYVKEPCQIFVYGNGDPLTGATKLLIIPRMMKSWDLVLREVTEKISLRTGQAVRKLYDMNYKLLSEPTQLENGRFYIAVGTEKIKKANYGETNKFTKSTQQHSPRRPNQPLPPIRKVRTKPRAQATENDKTTSSYTKMYAKKKKLTVMGASAATGGRPLVIESETDSVFHAKPVKVKRSSKPSTDAPPTTDPANSVFLSSAQQEHAEEVHEDEDTKVDLPVDQVPAETVEEEIPAVSETPVPPAAAVVAASPEPVEDEIPEVVDDSPRPAAAADSPVPDTPEPEKVMLDLNPRHSQRGPLTRSKKRIRKGNLLPPTTRKMRARIES